ncbi:MAG: hypothetical protein ACRECO_01300 [Xanthobacteraceae bacterium]
MQELEPTWGRALSVWWLITWRSMLGAVVLGAIVGGIFGFIVAMAGGSPQLIGAVSPFLGMIVGLVWVIAVVRMALRKKYSGFRIALVPRE